MTRIKLGGRELVVNDADVALYLKEGYSVIDAKGDTLATDRDMSYGELVKMVQVLEFENRNLRNALFAANDKLAELTAKKKGGVKNVPDAE